MNTLNNFNSKKFVYSLVGLLALVLCVSQRWIDGGVFATGFVALCAGYLGGQSFVDSKKSNAVDGSGGQPNIGSER